MKWLRRKLRRWIQEEDIYPVESVPVAVSDQPYIEGLTFTVMKAVGGVIVQSRTYDRRKDQSDSSTYIITDEENFAERIGQIVAMETLKL